MIIEIGIMAGHVLILLEDMQSPVSIKEVALLLEADEEMVLMSVGWLVREGHVMLRKQEGILLIDRPDSRLMAEDLLARAPGPRRFSTMDI